MPSSWTSHPRAVQFSRILLSAAMVLSTLLYLFWSRHWPLVGDASLIHYICFLMDHGMAPYRDLGDMNMPGALMIESAVMHSLGGGDLAWRVYDFALLGVAAGAMFAFTVPRKHGWFAGIFASCLFALIHGRDGLGQAGQRDLTMAVLMLAGASFLLLALQKQSWWAGALFGLCAGMAATIKPSALPSGLVLLLIGAFTLRRRGLRLRNFLTPAIVAFLMPVAAAWIFLASWHVVPEFLEGLRTVVPYYASLGHRPSSFVVLHSVSPILSLVLIWIVTLVLRRPALDTGRLILLTGVVFGFASCLLQPRGFPYYRYPLLAFLLPLMTIDFAEIVEEEGQQSNPGFVRQRVAEGLSALALLIGALVIAPVSTYYIHGYRAQPTDFVFSLEQDLSGLGGKSLSSQIQCIDSISGCGTALYRLGLVQSTGVLSDFLLFGPDRAPIIRQTRDRFLAAISGKPPRIIIVSSWLHIDGPDQYEKLDRWPAFKSYLDAKYVLIKDWSPERPMRWWSRQQWPDGYRIYKLKPSKP